MISPNSCTQRVLGRVQVFAETVNGWSARCPAHDDVKPSLSIRNGDNGGTLVYCHAGCDTESVCAAMGLGSSDLFPPRSSLGLHAHPDIRNVADTYDYCNEVGELLFQTVRYVPKDFKQRRPDRRGEWVWNLQGVRRVLYKLPELMASPREEVVWIVEGEKDADRLVSLGFVATTSPLGAGKWRDEYADQVGGRPVAALMDDDYAGRDHAMAVTESCTRKGSAGRIIALPGLAEKGDVSDWLDTGGSAERLRALYSETPVWTSTAATDCGVVSEGDDAVSSRPTATSAALGTHWPILDSAALYGLAGEVIGALAPTSEADLVSLLTTFLVYFGNAASNGPHQFVGEDRHGTNLFAVLVGETSSARKGSATGGVRRIMACADEAWTANRVIGGLSSGEGLIWAVRDPIVKRDPVKEKGVITGYQDVTVDPGEADKRLCCQEEEFSAVLKQTQRQGNTVSETLRRAWDGRGVLASLTKNSPARSTGAHVSVIGHITREELVRTLTETETANGLGNRFLWFAVRRSKVVAYPPRLPNADAVNLGAKVADALAFAKSTGEITMDQRCRDAWAQVYPEVSAGSPGIAGALTARAEAHALRLALIYALLDRSPQIRSEHLTAALAVVDYVDASIRMFFGDATGDTVADRILEALRKNGPMTQEDMQDLFRRNVKAAVIRKAMQSLEATGAVTGHQEATGGRFRTVWETVVR